MKDALGNEIQIGSYVAWPHRYGSSLSMIHGEVYKIDGNKIHVLRLIQTLPGEHIFESHWTTKVKKVFVCQR